ncbi:MAG TPA: patatin-like phospholipase family protein, partial [Flavitalea sp.]|nr:patatin-like phospholipase family protein [Flavitalea sp.]
KNQPLAVSDIRDRFGKQYVDLVQEGGGVHGVALAGYTYVLEKMGISFMKMAGTSAGSINTLLLNAVYTREEAAFLNKPGTFFETRSEKVLEYLANKPLTDMVDGHPMWRKVLLNLFSGEVGMGGIVETVKSFKRRGIILLAALLLLIVSALGLAFYRETNLIYLVLKWTAILSIAGLLIIIGLLVARIIFFRLLYKHSEVYGINPGDNFETWIQKDILEVIGINSVEDLQSKLKQEEDQFQHHYDPGHSPASPDPNLSAPGLVALLEKVRNPQVKIDDLFDQINEFLALQPISPDPPPEVMTLILNAFEQRLTTENRNVTKELVIVSSDITHEIKVEFPGMHKMYWGANYSISPAKYVRASMSVPFFFKPFKIDFDAGQRLTIEKEWFKYMKVQKKLEPCALLVDGGMLSNFPINVFYNVNIPVPRLPTMGIKLEYEDDSAPKAIKSLMGFGGKLVSTMRFFYDRDFILKHDMYQKTVRSIDTGKIHWLNFNLTDEQKIELFYRGALAATIFLAKHILNDTEVAELIRKGEKVRFNEKEFSIFHNETAVFKTEDRLIENSTFAWQQYKMERLMDRIIKTDQKQILKSGAALKNASTNKQPQP